MVLLLGGYKLSVEDVVEFARHNDIETNSIDSLAGVSVNSWARENNFKIPKLMGITLPDGFCLLLTTKATRDHRSVKVFQFEETEQDQKMLERVLTKCPPGWDKDRFQWMTASKNK